MRAAAWAMLPALVLSGCGYVGDPLPPALNIPQQVQEVTAVQRGASIVVSFTAPAQTTENLVLEKFAAIDLRIADKPVPADIPEPGNPVVVRTPAAPWTGQDVSVIVRLAGPRGRWSIFSAPVIVGVGPPLNTPQVTVASHPEGVRLNWQPVGGAQYRIFRDEVELGTTEASEFIDRSAVFGKEQKYVVQAFIGKRESEPTAVLAIIPRDEFAPAAPAALTAVAGNKSIELAWDRSPEPDVASYRIYRALSGDFAVLVDGVEAIAFSDRQVESGTKYRYRVTALDKSGNESEPSKVLDVQAP